MNSSIQPNDDFSAGSSDPQSPESPTSPLLPLDSIAKPPIRTHRRRQRHCDEEQGVPDKVAAELQRSFDLKVYLSYFPAVTEAGRAYLRAAMADPSRNPTGVRSTTTRHASLKTGQTITAESDRAEMPALLMADHTDDVLFAVEQPPRFGLVYPAGDSTGSGLSTPDLVLFMRQGPAIVECKMEREVAAKCITQRGRYQRNDDGTFRSDPASAATVELGLPYRILTEANYEGRFLEALNFLIPYFRSDLRQTITDDERALIYLAVESEPGITATKLPISDATRRADLVYSMLARRELFAPLSDTRILALDQLRLFRTPVQERAYALFCGHVKRVLDFAEPVARRLPPGSEFKVNRVTFTVICHRGNGVFAHNNKSGVDEEISYVLLQQAGVRLQLREEDMTTRDLLVHLGEERLQGFLRNRRLIQPYLPFGKRAGQTPENRNTRRLLAAYRAASVNPGGGERALVPYVRRGCQTPRKSEASEALLVQVIEEEFLKPGKLSPANTYRRYLSGADKLQLTTPDRYTYRSVARRLASLDTYVTTLKREGKRVALKFRPPSQVLSILGPPNGLAPWAVGHMDHTKIDVLVLNPLTGEFERPWISALVDGYDGRILAAVIWFGSPNTATVFELLKDCLRRHGVLPCKIRCDWGAEFRSVAVQITVASLGIDLSYRIKGDPTAGAPVETSFNGMNARFFHPLAGATPILRNAREATAAVQPVNFACWRMKEFLDTADRYIAAHNKAPREHRLSPDDTFSTFIAVHGVHCASWLSPELIERLQQVPLTNTRIVSKKSTIRVRSVDYTAPELSELVGQEVRVFADKKDPRIVYIDHPRTRLRVVCTCVTKTVAYAGSAEEAAAVVESRMENSYRRVQDSHAVWAKFLEENRQLEIIMRDEMQRERAAPAVGSPESPAASTADAGPLIQVPAANLIVD